MLAQWSPTAPPEWVTCVPSKRHPALVPEFAERVAAELGLPFSPCLVRARDGEPQKRMQNSFQQAHNLDGAFGVDGECALDGACLLIDDVTDSGWTLTVTAALLRQAGCTAVIPVALALNSPRMD